jgi:antitoxin component YwqK of YwqJK toxin-antitoxin module
MKKIILIFLFVFVINPCFSKDITDTDLVIKNNIYFNIHTNKPVSGKVINRYPSGKVSVIKNYKQGSLHGPYEKYSESGQLEEKGTYKNGVRTITWNRLKR